jgi:hypothetical protein
VLLLLDTILLLFACPGLKMLMSKQCLSLQNSITKDKRSVARKVAISSTVCIKRLPKKEDYGGVKKLLF